jgi:hypothetical protein
MNAPSPQMVAPITANGTRRVQPGRRLSLRQVVDLQRCCYETAKGLSEDFEKTEAKGERAKIASSLSNLAKGWVALQDSKREILGKPRAGARKHAVEQYRSAPNRRPFLRPCDPLLDMRDGDRRNPSPSITCRVRMHPARIALHVKARREEQTAFAASAARSAGESAGSCGLSSLLRPD